MIPVEGIDKPIIDLLRREIINHKDNPPLIGAIVTRSRSPRTTQNHENEEPETSQSRGTHDWFDKQHISTSARDDELVTATGAKATQTNPSEDADHEINDEPHKIFQKQFEDRPDWRIPIYNYIKTGELPGERWEAQKIKARSSHYCIMEIYKQTLHVMRITQGRFHNPKTDT